MILTVSALCSCGERTVSVSDNAGFTEIEPGNAEKPLAEESSRLGPPPINVTAENMGGKFRIRFTEYLPGDYNGDAVVDGADLFPLALAWGETVSADEGNECIDGNRDGVLDGRDLFMIAGWFGSFVEGYNVFSAEAAEGPFETLENTEFIPYSGCGQTHESVTTGYHANGFFEVRTGPGWPGDGDPPAWSDTVGIQSALAENKSVLVSWNSAEDAASPGVAYAVYWNSGPEFDPASAAVALIDDPEPGEGFDWQYRIAELENDTRYWIAVRARDSSIRRNEDPNNMTLTCTPRDNAAPYWTYKPGIRTALQADGVVTLYWYEASEDDSLPIHYNVYYGEGLSPDFAAATRLERVQTEIDQKYHFKYDIHGLEPDRTYWFTVRAEDSAFDPNEDDNETFRTAWPRQGSWRTEVVTDMSNYRSSLVFDPDDNPLVSFSSSSELKLARSNGVDWSIESLPSELEPAYDYSVTLDSHGSPVVACRVYVASSSYWVRYAEFDGSEWRVEQVDSGRHFGYNPVLTLTADDQPRLFYSNLDPPDNDRLLRAWREDDSWTIEQMDTGGQYDPASIAAAVDSDGNELVCYISRTGAERLMLTVFDGDQWLTQTVRESGVAQAYSSVVLALDPNGLPAIAYRDDSEIESRLWLSRFDGTTWSHEVVDAGFGNFGYDLNLLFDAGGNPWLAYSNTNYRIAKLAHHNGEGWMIETFDDSVYAYLSLARDSGGGLACCYRQYSSNDLVFSRFD